mgnify:CR=1 FL=1
MPALIGGLFWRGATRRGAAAGLIAGSVVWAYTLYFPSLGAGGLFTQSALETGPFGIGFLRPDALFGLSGLDPLVHAVLWSMVFNTGLFLIVSLGSFPTPLERLQGAEFVRVFEHSSIPRVWSGGRAEAEDLLVMAQRILGSKDATALFTVAASEQGKSGYLPDPTPEFLRVLERELAGSVGVGTAHAMIAQIHGGASVSVADLMAVADETAQIMEYSSQLEAKSEELARTARQLRAANDKLTQISVQKDAFLSQISHELRTPMTSIRAFSEILRDEGGLSAAERGKYASIILEEAVRLTRLLDDLLDLSVLENGQVNLNFREAVLSDVLDHSVRAALQERGIEIRRDPQAEALVVETDVDRLSQVFINLIANAQKYCDAAQPVLTIAVSRHRGAIHVDFSDNGSGVETGMQGLIFEKFSRIGHHQAGGAGLGLAICRSFAEVIGGTLSVESTRNVGSVFTLRVGFELASAAELVPPEPDWQPPENPVRRLCALVVEDHTVNQLVAQSYLERLGHDVVCVPSAEMALDLIAHDNFDVVLMDVSLPGISGTEATRRIRAEETYTGHHLPVIGLSAHVQDSQIADQLDAGMDCFVAKPVSPERLAAAIEDVMDGRQRGVFLSARSADWTEEPSADVLAEVIEDLGPVQAAEAAQLYLTHLERDFAALELALSENRPEAAAKLAHRMKGAAGNFHLPELCSELGALENRLTSGAGGGDTVVLRDLAEQARTAVNKGLSDLPKGSVQAAQ